MLTLKGSTISRQVRQGVFQLCCFFLSFQIAGLGQTVVFAAPELVTDRPDQTESSVVVPKGLLQAEMGWKSSRNDEGESEITKHQFPATLMRLGIMDRAELRFDWEGGLWERNRSTSENVLSGGVGDSRVGTKVLLWGMAGWRPETAVLAGVSLPTGKQGFSTERFDPSLRIAMSNQITERLGLGYNVALDWTSFLETPGDRDTRPSFAYSAALGIGLTGRSSVFVEAFGSAPLHSSGTSRVSFDSGITYLALTNLQLDLSVGRGLSSEAADWFVGAGISFRVPR